MTRHFRLNRRALLRGAGGVAIALPWLEAMSPEPARAATVAAKRFVAVYTPGGTVLEKWRPTGTEDAFDLGPILQPLSPLQDRLLVVDGLDMPAALRGDQDQAGLVAWLTGTEQSAPSAWATGPSVDQTLASQLSAGKSLSSLQLAIRWGTGGYHGVASPANVASYADTSTFAPIAPALDPVVVWQQLFGELPPNAKPDPAGWDKSILDAVGRRYAALAARLGAADRQRLEQHLTRLRELEQSLASGTGSITCAAPELIDTSDYNPLSGLDFSVDPHLRDPATDAAIPKVGRLMTDMLVMALACDITAVGLLQWADPEAEYTLPWLGLNEAHAFYQNDGGYRPDDCATIGTWYCEQHAYLLQQMQAVDMGGHSLLDESVVFFGSHIQSPPDYAKTDMPFLLAGGGGGLRGGRWLQNGHRPHNDLLVSLLNLCGDPRQSFGDAEFCTGPLTNLV